MAEKYTVLGAGHGGKAMAAHLALMGMDVALWNRTFEHISVIKQRGGIELESVEGGPHGFGTLSLVTSDIEQAIGHAKVIMVVLPSSAHADIAKAAAHYLIASVIHHTDYWWRGRTVEKLGLGQWSVSELTRFVQEGKTD